jgi:hypothetical protein
VYLEAVLTEDRVCTGFTEARPPLVTLKDTNLAEYVNFHRVWSIPDPLEKVDRWYRLKLDQQNWSVVLADSRTHFFEFRSLDSSLKGHLAVANDPTGTGAILTINIWRNPKAAGTAQ